MKAAVITFPGSNREGDVARALAAGRRQRHPVWHADTAAARRHRPRRPARRLLLWRLSAHRRHRRPRQHHGRDPRPCRPRRFRAGHLQRLPDRLRGRPAAGHPDAQRRPEIRLPPPASHGRARRHALSPAPMRRARSSMSASPMARATTSPMRRRWRGSKARASSPSAMPTRRAQVTPDANPNGSQNGIAGIYSPGFNVLGLMPHPENLIDSLTGGTDGRGHVREPDGGRAGLIERGEGLSPQPRRSATTSPPSPAPAAAPALAASSGPTCLSRMRPSGPMTKVSGTP